MLFFFRCVLVAALAESFQLPSSRRMIPVRKVSCSNMPDQEENLTLYFTSGCGFCVRAKSLLDEMGVPWTGIDVGREDARDSLARKTGGVTSVPQIYSGELRIGGFDDFVTMRESGELAEVLKSQGIVPKIPQTNIRAGLSVSDRTEVDIALLHAPGMPLNILKIPTSNADGYNPSSMGQVAAELQDRALKLFDAFVAADGSRVDYKHLAKSSEMADFVAVAARLADYEGGARPGHADQAKELASHLGPAFWINLYNALVMHGQVVAGEQAPSSSTPEARQAFFSGETGVKYRVGPFDLSLDDIEHGILRSSPVGDPRAFRPDDPCRDLAMAKLDPRIHFALNCGARSCPPVRLFSEAGLNKELSAAAASFVSLEVSVPDETGQVYLSKLFEWWVYWLCRSLYCCALS